MENSDYLGKCYEQDPAMVFRKIAGECLLVPIRHNLADLESIYILNEVGGHIWELIDGRRPVREIRDLLVAEFEVSPQEAEGDLLTFLDQIQAIGGIRLV